MSASLSVLHFVTNPGASNGGEGTSRGKRNVKKAFVVDGTLYRIACLDSRRYIISNRCRTTV